MRKPLWLGVDVGSISTKGVVIDENGTVMARGYLWTEGDPVDAVGRLLPVLERQLPLGASVAAVGATGSARRLVGVMLGANSVKNEITAHAVGTMSRVPEVRTILEIGGQDSKIILLRGGVVVDYAMNTLCAAGTGAFLSSQAKRLGCRVEELGAAALRSRKPSRIAARCTVFSESDMIHKAQTGHSREDLIAGLCEAVASNFLSNVGKGKKIEPPVVFQGGVSKNEGVRSAFERQLGMDIRVEDDSHLFGALGAALLSRDTSPNEVFRFDLARRSHQARAADCDGCPNHCEVVSFYRDGKILDVWGNRCPEGVRRAGG